MIEINLLPGKKKKAAGGAGLMLSMPDFRAIISQIKDPWLIGAVGAWVVVGGGGAALFVRGTARLRAAESRLEAVKTEKRRYDIVIAQKRQAEKVRDSLVSQINMIRTIDADRYVWPHVLDQVTKALPPYTWVTRVQSLGAIVAGAQPGQQVVVQTDSTGAPLVRVSM